MDPVNVFDYEALARTKMDPAHWDYIQGGSDDEVTLRSNRASLECIRLRPRVLVDVSANVLNTRTSVLGTPVSMPLMVAPMALHCLAHPEGECATAQAAGRANTLMIASTTATQSLEEIAQAASGPLWFQLYVYPSLQFAEKLVHRAESAGYRAIVLTVDLPTLGNREKDRRNNVIIPPPPSIEALPEIVKAIAGRCEVYFDGGIRRGTDILKALALGARAVLVGRPVLWGLAANGTEGAYHVLEILRKELELAMALSGRPTLSSIEQTLVKM